LGETFGLAVAEFSLSGKPTITNFNSPHRFHMETLQDKVFIYKTYDELRRTMMLMNRKVVMDYFPPHRIDNGETIRNRLSTLYSEFSPCKVMKKFNDEFFDGQLVPRDGGVFLRRFCKDNAQIVNVTALKQLGIRLF